MERGSWLKKYEVPSMFPYALGKKLGLFGLGTETIVYIDQDEIDGDGGFRTCDRRSKQNCLNCPLKGSECNYPYGGNR